MSVPLRREPYKGRPKRKATEAEKWMDEVLADALEKVESQPDRTRATTEGRSDGGDLA